MTEQLRAARFTRESTKGQDDRHGPEAQREHQDRAIERLGATDTGIHWRVAHSGLSVHQTSEWADMIARAGRDYDVLIVAYTSRLARSVESQIAAVKALHAAGASVYFCDERIRTSEPRDWENWMREAVEAESYSRRLARRVTEAYEAKWRRGRPGGNVPYGYRADFSIDPIAAEKVKSIFTDYATTNASLAVLAERYGVEEEAVKNWLRNRTYLGVAIRHGTMETTGTFEPIVTPELFAAAASARQNKHRAGGPPTYRPNMLRKIVWCSCGTHIRLDGRDRQKHDRVRHVNPCEAWGAHERKRATYFTLPIQAALLQMELTEDTIERMVNNALARTQSDLPLTTLDTARARKRLRDAYDSGKMDAASFVAKSEELASQAAQPPQEPYEASLSGDVLRASLNQFSAMIGSARGKPWEQEVWANVTERYFERIEYHGPDQFAIVPTREGSYAITPETFPHRVVLAPPEGFEPPTPALGRRRSIH